MSELTKRQLKKKIERIKVAEVLSALDIKHVENAVDVGSEDLIEIAFLAQHPHERAGMKFAGLINENRIKPFFNALDCPFPLGDSVEVIFLETTVLCKKLS